MLLVVWVPAAVAGLTTALSSANGATRLCDRVLPRADRHGCLVHARAPACDAAPDLAPAVVLLALGVAIQYLSVYRDSGIHASDGADRTTAPTRGSSRRRSSATT